MSKAKKIRFPGPLIKAIKKILKRLCLERKQQILHSGVSGVLPKHYSGHKHPFYYCLSIIFDLDNLRGN